jgi:hypothetical protein
VPSSLSLDKETNLYKTAETRIWIPNDNLVHRIIIIAHNGSSGHRGFDSTKKIITDRFWWTDLHKDVKFFLSKCLHCLKTYSGIIPRPFGEQIHGQYPNEVIHYDFLVILGHYVLIIRDDISGFTRLRYCEAANAETVATHLINWITEYGIPKVQDFIKRFLKLLHLLI